MAQTDLITSVEAAHILGRSIRTVHRLVATDVLVPAKRMSLGPNGAFLFDRAVVEKLAKSLPFARPTMNVPLDVAGDVKQSA